MSCGNSGRLRALHTRCAGTTGQCPFLLTSNANRAESAGEVCLCFLYRKADCNLQGAVRACSHGEKDLGLS
jgi:hypothetical protein